MSSFELNKIFAAILSVALVIMLSGFIANKAVFVEDLDKDAIEIEGAELDGHGGGHGAQSGPQIPEPILGLLAQADIERGAKVSKTCVACHSFEKGGPVKQGPNLWNIVQKLKCETSGFAYSDALKSLEGKWDYDSLNKFIAKPKQYAPGTKMNFVGIKKPEDRAAVIAWLRQQSDSPAPLPSQAEIDAEMAAFAPVTPEEHGAEAPEETTHEEDAPAH